jgi:thioredoxin-like negative regulator of GroEL
MTRATAAAEPVAQPAQTLREAPVLVFFYSPTSGSSRRVEGFLAQVLQRRGNHDTFRLHRVDADRNAELVARLRVSEVPTLLVVQGGRVAGRLGTPRGSAAIREFLAPWLK